MALIGVGTWASLTFLHPLSSLSLSPLAWGRRPRPPAVCCGTQPEDSEILPQSYFAEISYDEGGVPWDLGGRPQPPVRNAAQDGSFGRASTILDCGCGAGDNANWLAARGFDVVGFDVSSSAIETAIKRSEAAAVSNAIAEANGAATFFQASATALEHAEVLQARADEIGGFEVALDSALLHCLNDEAQEAYVDGLRRLLRPGGRLFVGCFSDANPDPWTNPRRLSEERLRTLLSAERGWRLVDIEAVWYERPAERATSRGGAWTMAWWCTAELVAPPPRRATALTGRFPKPETPPAEVVAAQLDALRLEDIPRAYSLCSRARRLAIQDSARRDVRESNLAPEREHELFREILAHGCPGLVGHRAAEIVASLSDPVPQRGRLPTHLVRVRVDEAQHFLFTLTRQSDFDGGDVRDKDGFERCWFVWTIGADDDRGGNSRIENAPTPIGGEPIPA